MSKLQYTATIIFIAFELVALALLSAYFHTWLIISFSSILIFPMLIRSLVIRVRLAKK